ncbi:DUF6221 family protein [Streptomyces sp. NPDC004008]
MTTPDRMLAWLREAMDAAQRDAESATPGPWEPEGDDPTDDIVLTVHDAEHGDLIGNTVAHVRGGNATTANMRHIARHDPAAVLRRIAKDRELLNDLLAEKHHVVEDPAYTCPAATTERDGGQNYQQGPCDCDRDTRVQRRVRLLAEGYDWTECE